MKCPYCDQEHPDTDSFCPITGKPLQHDVFCPHCGEMVNSGLAICPKCGVPLGQTILPQLSQNNEQLSTEMEKKALVNQSSAVQELAQPVMIASSVDQDNGKLPDQEALFPPSDLQPLMAAASTSQSSAPEVVLTGGASARVKPINLKAVSCVVSGCLSLPLVILLFLALFVFIDPFNLHVWGRLNGSYDAAAEVMPADTGMYLGVNIANALLTRVDRRLAPFSPPETGTEASLSTDFIHMKVDAAQIQQPPLFDSLIQQIERETGVKVPDDLRPWIGQYVGIGVVKFEDSGDGSPIPSGWIIALEARNLSRADEFLVSLQDDLTYIKDTSFNRDTYNRVQVTVQQENGQSDGISFGRAGRMVLIASDFEILKHAIDNNDNQALSDQAEYNQLIDLRSRTWFANLYVSHNVVGSLISNLLQGYGASSAAVSMISPLSDTSWSGMLLSVEAIREGLRLDGYTLFDGSHQSPTGNVSVEDWYAPPAETIQLLPQETVIYLASSRFDLLSQGLLSQVSTDPVEQSYFFDSFEETLGFSLQDDLLDHLNGQWAIYVVPSTHGPLFGEENMNMAIGILVQTDNKIDLQLMSEELDYAGQPAGITVLTSQQDGYTYYKIGNIGDENPMFVFGQGNGYFSLATGIDALQTSASNETSLVNSPSYQKVIGTLPEGMQPTFYLDITGFLSSLREGMDASEIEFFNDGIGILGSIDMIASGNRVVQPGIAQNSVVILISPK